MANCSPTTLVVGRPTKEAITAASNQQPCSGTSVIECCDETLIGPRPNRNRVKEQIREFILLMLGAPVVSIELDEQQV